MILLTELFISGFIMQEVELIPQIVHTSHSKDLCHDLLVSDDTYKKCSIEDESQYISSRLQTLCMEHNTEIQKLQTEYLTNINKLHTEIETWKQTSEVMKKYVDEIKSSLQYLKVIFKSTLLNFFF
jgi:geranylgeranyl pyrophosphate synthase